MRLLTMGQSIGLLVGFFGIAASVWLYQNNGKEKLGGGISLIKAAWLAYAIVLWIAVPWVLAGKGTAFLLLAVSMTVGAVVELPLCAFGRWRVAYGVGHDVIHAALVAVVLVCFPIEGLGVWALLTLVALATELLFVYWFVRSTDGPEKGVFFVPGGEAHRKINQRTAFLFLPQLFAFAGVLFLP
jgi:hypothetical protein